MTGSATALALSGLVRPLRRLFGLAWLGFAIAGALLVLGLLSWAARLEWYAEPSWVLTAWAAATGVLLALFGLGWKRLNRLTPRWLGSWLESRGHRRGSLTGHLEPAAPGTSVALQQLADAHSAASLRQEAARELLPLREEYRRWALGGGGAVMAGLTLLWSAGPTHGSPSLLWRPVAAWTATTAPVRLSIAAELVDRGSSVAVNVEALGRRQAILWTRAPGETWRGRGIKLDSLGQATREVGPLESDLFLRVTSGGRGSDTLQVKVRIPAFLGAVTVTARYPDYLRLEDEPISIDGDTVFVPAGTRLETKGEATADLSQAAWMAKGFRARLSTSGQKFSGLFTPTGSRLYSLELATASGQPLSGDTVRVPLVAVPDSIPRIDVPVPGTDTLAPLSLRVPLVIDAQDDHGIRSVAVESRRISRLGFADPAQVEAVSLPQVDQQHTILGFELDLNSRGLLPGDTVRYFVSALDNAPTPNPARSREYILRLPTLSEVRQATRQASESVSGQLDSIAAATQKLGRQTEDLSQERPRADGERPGSTDESLSFEAAKRAEAVAASQEEMQQKVEEVKSAIEALEKSAQAAGLADPEWQQRLEEIRQELDRALTPEMRDKLAELQKALKDLDPERTQDALKDLAKAQEAMREALERSKELFRRAALEGDLANLTAESKELAQAQQQWNQQVLSADSARAAAEEKALAARSDSLASALDQVGEQLKDDGRQEAMQDAAERAQDAGQQMKQASQSASSGKRSQAKKEGEKASQSLDPLSDELQQQRKNLAQQWQADVAQALDRSLAETSRLAERELDVNAALSRGDVSAEVQAEQGALEEGVDRLLEQVKEVSGKNALVSQQSAAALSAAKDQMRRTREALANAAPNAREGAQRSGDAVDALNAASYNLLRSKSAVEGAGSGSGLAEALEQMNQMASQQGQLSQQAGGLLPMPGGAGAVQEQIRRLGAQQRALAERLERMRAGGNMPGAADLAEESKDLARRLEAGRLDRQTVERQERLFRRMLDAGRTLQGQDEDERKERQSTTSIDDSVHLPPALRSLLQGNDAALRIPSWELLQNLSPAERRLVVEYFRRLSEQEGKTAGNGEP